MKAADRLEEAWDAEDVRQQFQLYLDAARLADLEGDEFTAHEARDGILTTAGHIGDGPSLLSAFAWLLAEADRESPDHLPWDLLWTFKWALGAARSLANVPLERLEALTSEFARRSRAAGYGDRTATVYGWRLALHRGDLAAAEALRQHLKGQRSTRLDCRACDTDLRVMHHLAQGKLNAALKAAQPLLSGKYHCNRVPGRTHAHLLLPLWQAGRPQEAQEQHERGYPLIEKALDELAAQAQHLAYLTLSGQHRRAGTLYRRHAPQALLTADDEERFWWNAACALPSQRNGHRAEHLTRAQEAAVKLDARNGTDAFACRLTELLELDRAGT